MSHYLNPTPAELGAWVREREAIRELIAAARESVGDTSPEDYAATVDGAANLTAHDWVMRAVETLRELDTPDCPMPDAVGDLLDDLTRALRRMKRTRAALSRFA